MPYLFNRAGQVARGNVQDAQAWAAKMTEKVNAISEVPVNLWTPVFSPKVGTLSWVAIVQDLVQLETIEAKLMADSGYLSLVEEGSRFLTDAGLDDGLVNLIHADPDAAATEPQYATIVQAVLAPGSFESGVNLGVEIAQRAKKITGRPTSFGSGMTGAYGSVGWIGVYDSVDQLQAAGDALSGDHDFAKLLDKEASKAYIPGMTTQLAWRRVI